MHWNRSVPQYKLILSLVCAVFTVYSLCICIIFIAIFSEYSPYSFHRFHLVYSVKKQDSALKTRRALFHFFVYVL